MPSSRPPQPLAEERQHVIMQIAVPRWPPWQRNNYTSCSCKPFACRNSTEGDMCDTQCACGRFCALHFDQDWFCPGTNSAPRLLPGCFCLPTLNPSAMCTPHSLQEGRKCPSTRGDKILDGVITGYFQLPYMTHPCPKPGCGGIVEVAVSGDALFRSLTCEECQPAVDEGGRASGGDSIQR